MIVTIDGPAGAGKSTVARLVARCLRLPYLDTGAMYRAYTWKALRDGLDLSRPRDLLAMIRRTRLTMEGRRVRVDGRDVSRAIRTAHVTRHVRFLADAPSIRREMVRQQREIARRWGGAVTEGRDQGSVAFPRADVKIYLDASVRERAWRRWRDLRALGEVAALAQVRREVTARDRRDRTRKVGRLRVPQGAVRINTTGLKVAEVVAAILRAVAGRRR